jgi:steroid delta-isomerase-like uncharacterized protein
MLGKGNFNRFVIIFIAFYSTVSLIITGCSTSTREGILERNKSLVRKMNYEVWNKGNLDIIDELYTPGFVLHFLPDSSEFSGINSLREHVREHREAFPDWQEHIMHIVAEADLVMIHYVSTGTNEGSWLGKPATGRRIQINVVSIFRIEDGKIAEQWLMPDIFSMQQQLHR